LIPKQPIDSFDTHEKQVPENPEPVFYSQSDKHPNKSAKNRRIFERDTPIFAVRPFGEEVHL
jgi:hypothetical protein